ncbi:hypothetical protein M408DRAFT_246144 [Serendipita vermifera MAFF 305830]|uniref:Uncharacterized protein n=1 Tax=Serendipita vermifera MAFF 305830 TaxID=933852 RepID=A0A0C3AVW3_SERVB|nr:hypothetical protein M408DRAFT_246144 [Serendipita vermifera MAFF 305830]
MDPSNSPLSILSDSPQAPGTSQVCNCTAVGLSRVNVADAQPINDHFETAIDSPEGRAQQTITIFASAPPPAAPCTAPTVAETAPTVPTSPAYIWPQNEEDRWVNRVLLRPDDTAGP